MDGCLVEVTGELQCGFTHLFYYMRISHKSHGLNEYKQLMFL